MSHVIPPVGSKGKFNLATPFENILSPLEEYTVTAVRSINEIMSDDPLTNIYVPVGLENGDLIEDVKNNVPIVVLLSTGGEYAYIPGNRFLTIPLINGTKHQEKILSIPLGLLPNDLDLSVLQGKIEDLVKEATANTVESKVIESSAIIILDDIETKRLELLRNNSGMINKSNKILYEETLELLNHKTKQCTGLENYIKKHLNK